MLSVFFEDRLVGTIQENNHGLSFTYNSEWLEAKNNFAISLSMPLQTQPYSPEIATPWFANLLPEDRQLELIGMALGRSQSDVYGLLEKIGRETAGALSIGAPELPQKANYRELNNRELAEAIKRLPQRPLLAGEEDITMSLAGAQTKLAIAIFDKKIFLPLHGGGSTHILKPASDRLHATVENEFLCMRLAKSLNLLTAQTEMGVAEEHRYLLVERYDRKKVEPYVVKREHQEDFCQALGILPSKKYEARGGPGLKDLFGTIERNARRSAADRLQLLDLVIFGCCIGDTDRHGKNFSLILTDGGPRLAPGYDLMSALAYGGITGNLAMKIAGKNRPDYLERRHWERFAGDVGLSPAATSRRVAELAAKIANRVIELPTELASEFPANAEDLRLFATRIHDLASTVSQNARRGPPTENRKLKADHLETG